MFLAEIDGEINIHSMRCFSTNIKWKKIPTLLKWSLWYLISFSAASEGEITSAVRQDYQSALEHAKQYFHDKMSFADIGPLFLKFKLVPDSVKKNDVPRSDLFSRLFGEEFVDKNLTITRMIDFQHEILNLKKPRSEVFQNQFYQLPKKYKATLVHGWDDVLIKALYCDQTGFDNVDNKILMAMRDNVGGYHDTHYLLALLMLEINQCWSDVNVKYQKQLVVQDIIKALERDRQFSDLYAERVVCLYWAGAKRQVRPDWIQLIKEAQRADGGWPFYLSDPKSDPHATGLAALSIRYYLTGGREAHFYKK